MNIRQNISNDIKNVIFDLDGTLLYTLEDLTDSVNYAVTQFHYPTYSTEQVRMMVGNGIRKLMERAIPEGEDNPDFEKAFAEFKSHYQKNCMNKTKPYAGIMELIAELKRRGIRIGIVSNKNQEALTKLCDHFFADFSDAVIGQQDGIPKKPAPDSVLKAMAKMQAFKEDTIYIGDSEVDALTAANTGIPCALVTWGFRDRVMLEQCQYDVMIDAPMDLVDYI